MAPLVKHIILAIRSNFKALAILLFSPAWAVAEAGDDMRVVSVNLCTDQLAMMMAPPDKLVSISHLSLDENVSAMSEAASDYAVNYGQLEEIVSLKPDLVLAHEWTSPLLLDQLRRLGIAFEVFSTPVSFDEITVNVLKMGDLLDEKPRAEAIAEEYKAEFSKFSQMPAPSAPLRLIGYGPNGWVSGGEGLYDQAVTLAGFDNLAHEYGYVYGGFMPLELLLTAKADVIITAASYPGHSRGEALMAHPAMEKSGAAIRQLHKLNALSCGLPQSLDAIRELRALREELQGDGSGPGA